MASLARNDPVKRSGPPSARIGGGILSAGRVSAVLASIPDPLLLLSPSERAKLNRFRWRQDHLSYLAAHALAAVLVARHSGSDTGDVRVGSLCPRCGGTDHGRPVVQSHPGVHLSLSHTDGYVCAGVASRPIAVDSEVVTRIPVAGAASAGDVDAGAAVTPDPIVEGPFDWVRFEALVKLGYFELDDLTVATVRALCLPPPRPGHVSTWRGHEVFDWADSQWIGSAVVAMGAR